MNFGYGLPHKNKYEALTHLFWTALVQFIRIGLAHKTHSCLCSSLMFISNVNGDGLLSYFDPVVHVLWLQSLLLTYVCFMHIFGLCRISEFVDNNWDVL